MMKIFKIFKIFNIALIGITIGCIGGLPIDPLDINGDGILDILQLDTIELSSISVSDITFEGFKVQVRFQGDNNRNASVMLWHCSGSCNPQLVNPSIAMIRENNIFTYEASSLPNSIMNYNPKDLVRILVTAYDPDGVKKNNLSTSFTLKPKPHHIRIEDRADGTGNVINSRTLGIEGNLELFAVARDIDGEYMGPANVSWSVTNALGNFSSNMSSSTIFQPTKVGTGVITASHSTLGSHSTGTITVTPSAPTSIRIESRADGNGIEIGETSILDGESLILYAISRDRFGNFVGNVSVDWSLNGSIGTLSSNQGQQTTFRAQALGTGIISITHGTLGGASTGLITVIPGSADNIKIENGANGSGQEVNNLTLRAGQSVTLYAIARDRRGNFVASVSVGWSMLQSRGILSSSNGSSTIFTAQRVTTGERVIATHHSLGTDQTGNFTITAGDPTRVVIESQANGTGVEINTATIILTRTLQLFAVSRDQFGNYTSNVNVNWSLNNPLGTLSNTNSSNTVFTAQQRGEVIITATHSSLSNDSTGILTLTAGPPSNIKIETQANGAGVEVGNLTLRAGESRTLYAISRDQWGNFVENVSVNSWNLSNSSGVLSFTSGPSTTFTAQTITNNQAITATHSQLGSDSTGTIIISSGDPSNIKIETRSDGAGNEIGDLSMTVGESFQLFAVSRDNFGNFVGSVSVSWSSQNSNGTFNPGVGSSTTYTATGAGTDRIRATHSTLGGDETGNITIEAVASLPVKDIYRSVGRGGDSSALVTGSPSNRISISNSNASFSSALPNYVGVGDIILYDPDGSDSLDSYAFVHARNSSTSLTIRNRDGNELTGVAVSPSRDWIIYRAYTSLSNAENGIENSLVDIEFENWSNGKDLVSSNQVWNIACYYDISNGNSDNSRVTFDGWTTNADNYIRVFTPFRANEVGISQRHKGVWNNNSYIIENIGSDPDFVIRIRENNVRIEGLQISVQVTGFLDRTAHAILFENFSTGETIISNNLIRSIGRNRGSAIYFHSSGSGNSNSLIYNNIIYDFNYDSSLSSGFKSHESGLTAQLFNNTFYNCAVGIHGESGTIYAVNNIVQNSSRSAYDSENFNSLSNNNISDDDSSTGGSGDIVNATVNFVNIAEKNFHLTEESELAINAGINLSDYFLYDIDNEPRGSNWDIGADQF